MYAGPLSDKSVAVILLNRSLVSAKITAEWAGMTFSPSSLPLLSFAPPYFCPPSCSSFLATNSWIDIGLAANTKATVRDLWLKQNVGTYLPPLYLSLSSFSPSFVSPFSPSPLLPFSACLFSLMNSDSPIHTPLQSPHTES